MGKTMEQLNYHIEWLEPSELIFYEHNAKLHDEKNVANIANSIRRYGWQQNVTITSDKVIIIGHGRTLAALEIGCKVPCKVIEDDLTDDDIRELRIADNLTQDGQYDWQQLGDEIDEFGLTFEGFDFDFGGEIDTLPEPEEEHGEVEEDDFDGAEPEEPKAKPGDLFAVGRHRLLCGDSGSLGDVSRLMDGAQADMFLTDAAINDKLDDDELIELLTDAYTNADLVMKPGAAFYIWYADARAYCYSMALHEAQWQQNETLIWLKDKVDTGKRDYSRQHESCQYGWKDGATRKWSPKAKQSTVVAMDSPLKDTKQKPVGLFNYCIKNSTNNGDIVLDLFAGSGVTLMACEQNGRTAYCMEQSPRRIDTIIQRFVQFTGKGDEVFLIRDGERIPFEEIYGEEF